MTTIRDVAAAAEVSTATVSRALRGLPGVSRSTRARVHAAAAELRFVTSVHAAALATRRTTMSPTTDRRGDVLSPDSTVADVRRVLHQHGYRTVLLMPGTSSIRRRLDRPRRWHGMLLVNTASGAGSLIPSRHCRDRAANAAAGSHLGSRRAVTVIHGAHR